ncbi:MAG TPA: ATP-binding protein [Geminicoccus sp.]|jgi:signal transduction histidine kinase/ActR/RegA family two-component response regulator|uniref:hybrid sensor histidine kinase/response regulator n=1 Tax=Geminicoccus sp. TaxID=2024832 RepID=UPI002E2EDB16|nr:ATP-binding protein [Geminicoccus sp.]HEX2524978.1 ATP-binding protein [Geminicoccus sp.]
MLSGLLTLLLCTMIAWSFLAWDRTQTLNAATKELAAASQTVAGTVRRTLGTLDLVVSLALDDLEAGQLDRKGVYEWLRRQAAKDEQLDALRTMVVLDANGVAQLSQVPEAVGYDLSDRDYVRAHRERRGLGMVIGTPVISRIPPHRRIVPISWAMLLPSGEVDGVLTVAASWRLYAQVFAGLLTRPGQTLALLDSTGTLYAVDAKHWPDAEEEPQRPAALGEWAGSGALAGQVVTANHLVAWVAVRGTDLQVVMSEPLGQVLRPWWQRVFLASFMVGIISLGMGFLSWLRQRNAYALRQAAELAEAHATEAKAAQAKAEEGERAKAQFLAAMSHEIRTPMTGVLGMADLLADEPLQPRQQAYVRAIRTSGQHLLSVINDILDFSRFGSGAVTLEEVDFSVGEILEQVRSIMTPQATERGLKLSFDLDEHSPPVVRGDPTRLRQILVNLIGNGLKFTRKGGVDVTIRCEIVDDKKVWFRFEVADTGIGIPKERQASLFQPFVQADQSTARKYGGTGLGLAICRQLVAAMGGEIGIQSTPGQGSVFSFQIPLQIGDVVIVKERAVLDPAVIRPLQVLIAEDVEVNRDLLDATLTRHGHAVTFAEDGEQAVTMASEHSFDVILMDVQMPVMDGIEATRRIRVLPPPAGSVPIVGLTANVMEAERQRCLSAGMNKVLTKPVAWEDLFQTLAGIATGKAVPEVAATPAPAQPPVPASGGELLDLARIEKMRTLAGPSKLVQFLQNALSLAEQLAAEMEELKSQPAELVKPAHRLAGTTLSMGLLRIGTLGREIEHRALEGQKVGDLLTLLNQTLAATKEELGRLQLLSTGD